MEAGRASPSISPHELWNRVGSAASPLVIDIGRLPAFENTTRRCRRMELRVVKGRREQLAGAATNVSSGEWHTLRSRAQGDRFTVAFDKKNLFTATDATFRREATGALWTNPESVARFDPVSIADHTHGIAGGVPVLAIEMYGHAYHLGFRAKAAAEIDAIMRNVAWPRVAARCARAVGVSGAGQR